MLPDFIEPMLSQPGEPFDSAEHLFEVKWDGTRAICFAEAGGYRLVNRRRFDMNDRYPDLSALSRLPAGTVLDGEIVVLKQGQPDFKALLSRDQVRSARRAKLAAEASPATYVVFDQLYADGRSIMDLPLASRRQTLGRTLAGLAEPRVTLSDGVLGDGVHFFNACVERKLEGVVAKQLQSRYLPGKRTAAWLKIKPRHRLLCAIIGYSAEENDTAMPRSLIIAAEPPGEALRCVGKVGSGLTDAMRRGLAERFRDRRRKTSLIPCNIARKDRPVWLEPGLFCTVSYFEVTNDGHLRAPVFEALHVPD